MLQVRRYDTLGHADYGWLQARYHFSFGEYRDARYTQHGALRVINDDVIAPHSGFDRHGHRDMEIITYVRQGAIRHKDSLGNTGATEAGNVQVMSAGTGIQHEEWNDTDTPTRLYQIWILPKKQGIAPRWDAKAFPREWAGEKLPILASGFPEQHPDALYINQDAVIAGGRIAKGASLTHPLQGQGYILVANGAVRVDDTTLTQGDGAAISGQVSVTFHAESDAEIVVIDVPAG